MTESSTDSATPNEGGTADEGGTNYTPPASQADLDKIIAERVNRTKNQFKDYADLKTKAAEFDKLAAANQSEAERQAQELTRWQTEAETWRGQAVGAQIQALAAESFADPTDAVTALANKNYLDAGGQIDQAAITADLADVLARKPHWAKTPGAAPTPRAPAPNLHQGVGGGSVSNPAAEFGAILARQLGGAG